MQEEKNIPEKKPAKKFLGIDLKDLYQSVVKSLVAAGILSLAGLAWLFITAPKPPRSVSKPSTQQVDTMGQHKSLITNPYSYLGKIYKERKQRHKALDSTLNTGRDIFDYYIFLYDRKLLNDRISIYTTRNSTGKLISWGFLLLLTYLIAALFIVGGIFKLFREPSEKVWLTCFLLFFVLLVFVDVWLTHFAFSVLIWYLFKIGVLIFYAFFTANLAFLIILLLTWGIATLTEKLSSGFPACPYSLMFGVIKGYKAIMPFWGAGFAIFFLYMTYSQHKNLPF
jgi:hypothetical protein